MENVIWYDKIILLDYRENIISFVIITQLITRYGWAIGRQSWFNQSHYLSWPFVHRNEICLKTFQHITSPWARNLSTNIGQWKTGYNHSLYESDDSDICIINIYMIIDMSVLCYFRKKWKGLKRTRIMSTKNKNTARRQHW